jgi:signal transduction histidine kinase
LILDKREAITASLSNALRTPINHIIGYSEMLQEKMQDGGLVDFLPDIEKIRASSDGLMKWVEKIIGLSKIESGWSELQHEKFMVKDLLEELSQKVQVEMDKAENVLHIDEDGGEIEGDRGRVFRVLSNLLTNACQTTHKGEISLRVSRETVGDVGWISFDIKDTEAVINPKILKNLFKGYTHADDYMSSGFGGEAW